MAQTLPMMWIYIAAGVVALLLVLWLILGRYRARPRQRSHRPDVLDEGVAPAQRNQALIDAPSATTAALAASGPDIFAGVGEVIAMATTDEAEAAPADDLTRIKGIGPKLAALLKSLGIIRYAQIAALSEEDLTRLDRHLGAFAGRPRRDSWVEQASYLANDDKAGFEAKFGKL